MYYNIIDSVCLAGSHYPIQYRLTVTWTHRNTLQGNINQNKTIFMQENQSECRLQNGSLFVSASLC